MIPGRTIILLSLVLSGAEASSQTNNLVRDPGFEDRTDCPKHFTHPHEPLALASWWLPTFGTADLFSPCTGSHDVSVPDNLFGHQRPRSGECYTGFGIEGDVYAEYLQTRLTRSLRKGATYEVSFHVSLADNSEGAVKKIGAFLGKERMDVHDTKALYVKPQVRMDSAVMDTSGWVRISGRFVAGGGELYLTIGCFPAYHVDLVAAHPDPEHAQHFAYYFLDDVQVIEVRDTAGGSRPNAEVVAAPASDPFVLGDVLFDHDRAELKPEAMRALDAFHAGRLKGFTGTIEIIGFTDSTGTSAHNLQLSQRRAEAVAAYLRSKGVDLRRMSTKGLGDASPVSTNATSEGRQANRRVEIHLVERAHR
jgi:outer membrane protein OmpA-like peptidoglycan-associated protein